jgi:hypothetical protein
MEEASPYLKAAFMKAVDNQIASNDPPEARETLKRLISEGISEEDARIYIGQAVCIEVWDIVKNKGEFNLERYVRNLNSLPEEPRE